MPKLNINLGRLAKAEIATATAISA